MKVEKLKAGQTFKNYKALCEELEMEEKKANSKKAQLSELSCFCNYSNVGHQIIIHKVFKSKREKVDNRGKSAGSRNNNTVYSNIIQLMITDLLAQCNGHISISRSRLQLMIGMTNKNYNELGDYLRKLSDCTLIPIHVLYDFYNTNNGNFKRRIESALNSLQNKATIIYTIVHKVKDKDSSTTRTADELDLEIIMECQRAILDEWNYSEMKDIPLKDRKKFRRKVQDMLNELSNIEYYYKAYDITINKKYIEQERNKLQDLVLEEVDRNKNKYKLNKTVKEQIMNNATKRQQLELEKGEWGKAKNKTLEARRSDTYIKNINELALKLIDLDADKNFAYNVKNFSLEGLEDILA
ncbi:hypothetical protein [Fictibacillus sp. JL2B1089]|uniref:hypothetical protein n=1 Tax=Fictibacillus sp. JL2B1089 TaxID=3399565 RepID=UPI003A860A31